MSFLRQIEDADNDPRSSATKGTPNVSDARGPILPTEEAEMLDAQEAVEETFAEVDTNAKAPDRQRVKPPLGSSPWAFLLVLFRPVTVLRTVTEATWRIPLAVLGGLIAIRTVVYVIWAAGSGADMGGAAFGAASSLFTGAIFLGIVYGLLVALAPDLREYEHRMSGFALATLACMPVAIRALVQTAAMPINGQELNPTGLFGYFFPDAPQVLLWALAPIDFFGIWALVLAGIALYVGMTFEPAAEPVSVAAATAYEPSPVGELVPVGAVAAEAATGYIQPSSALENFKRSTLTRTLEIIAPALCWGAVGVLVAVCFGIIGYLLFQGIPSISWQLLTTDPIPALTESLSGGIRTPIGGTIILLIIGTALVFLPAIGSATYLSEYMPEDHWLTKTVRFGLEMLAGVPSIVFGMWGIAFFTLPQFTFLSGHAAIAGRAFGRSFLVGAIVLTIHILPFVIKVMEEAIRSVPSGYRQAAAALGMPKWATIRKIILPAATPGIMTAVILGAGLIAGDTAVVKLCIGDSMIMTGAEQWWLPWNWLSTLLGQGSTLTTFTYYSTTEGNSPTKAFAAAFVLIIVVLALNLTIEAIMRRRRAAETA